MDVPLMATVWLLKLFLTPSESAETIFTPGAVTVGLNRPSAVGPLLLNHARFSPLRPFSEAPTLTTFFAVAGVLTVLAASPELPLAKNARKSLFSHIKRSAVLANVSYALSVA